MHLTLFGPPTHTHNGQPAVLDTRKALALAAYLAATGTAHSRDHLAALLWPESDGSRAKGALRRTLSTLKGALRGAGLEADGESIALSAGRSLRPDDGLSVDVWAFHAALAECASHGHPPDQPCPLCAGPLNRAAQLYTADFLAGFSLKDSAEFDDWQYFQAESLRREFVSGLDRLVQWNSAQQQWDAAIDNARRRLAVDTLHEAAHRQLMRLYALADQRAAALRQYRECVRILDEELGVPPLDETSELYEEIQSNRLTPALDMPAVRGPMSALAPFRLPLVGRDEEWRQIQNLWLGGGQGILLVLSGEAGIGKSRLLEELLAHVQNRAAVTALGRCFPGENSLAFGGFMEALRPLLGEEGGQRAAAALPPWQQSEVARLFPGLLHDASDLPPASPLESPGGQARFFQALADLLSALLGGESAGLLAFDDLHWADSATLDLLAWLARRIHGLPFSMALAWRSGEESQPQLQQLAQAAQRSGQASGQGTLLSLERLRVEDVMGLIPGIDRTIRGNSQQIVVDSRNRTLAQRLHAETEGIPFLLAEQLAALREGGDASAEIRLAPASVRELFASRLESLDGMAAQVLSAAAVIGRSFDLETVQAAAGRSEEESLSGLETLLQRRLVVEQTGEGAGSLPRYDFCHEKLRELVYDETTLARRRLLHRRVAESFGRRAGRLLGWAAQAAYHRRWAGQEEEAAQLYALAGDEARQLYANAEALAHYRTALALGHSDTSRLHAAIGKLLTLRGEYTGALLALEQAAAGASGVGLAAIEEEIGGVYQRQGEWHLAEEHYRMGLDALANDEDSAVRTRLLSSLSHTAHRQGDDTRALSLAQEAQTAALSANDAQAQADVANLLGLLAHSRGDNRTAIRHLQTGLGAATGLSDPSAAIAARNNLALALADSGDFANAQVHLLAALESCVRWGDRHREAALHNNLADLLHRVGEEESSMAHLKQAVALFAEIGEPGSLPTNAEIWKLAEW
jgi:predicted ATPase/DNA-binding SARP family transcriptional activator